MSEELTTEDLEVLITFLGMISSDLALLLIKKRRQQPSQQVGVIAESQDTSDIENVDSSISRSLKNGKVKKRKKVKKKKIKKTSNINKKSD